MLTFRDILPPAVVIAESIMGDDGRAPGPERGVARPRRPYGSRAAPALADIALARLGIASSVVDHGEAGEPIWPEGVVGSVTHEDGFHAAAVAPRSRVLAVGIDVVAHRELPESLRAYIRTTEEAAQIRHLSQVMPETFWDCVLFGAKEAVYKALFPSTRQWLEFGDVVISFSPHRAAFSARVRGRETGSRWRGRYRVDAGFVGTSFVCTRVG